MNNAPPQRNVATVTFRWRSSATRLEDLVFVCGKCHALIRRTKDANENLRGLRQHFGST